MREETWLNDYVFTVNEFLSAEECQKHIKICEDIGFEDALVTTAKGSVRAQDVRNNERVMFQNQEIADWIWERAADFVPLKMDGRTAIGINELIRYYRYDVGQKFDWHQDFPFERDNGEKSYLTLLIYLNDGFEGGETSFDDSCSDEPFDEFSVTPEKGMALFFEHQTQHMGELVSEGRKYVLRTDVMYSDENDEPDKYDHDGFEEDDVDNW